MAILVAFAASNDGRRGRFVARVVASLPAVSTGTPGGDVARVVEVLVVGPFAVATKRG